MLATMMRAAIRNAVREFGYDIINYGRQDSLYAHLRELLRASAINCVLDVGAHVGDFGKMLREVGYAGRIISFEPVQDSFDRLKLAAAADHEWRTERMALGREEVAKQINVSEASNFSSFRSPNQYATRQFGAMPTVRRVETVVVRRLDSVLAELLAGIREPRVFLKIDTQGYDLEVLEGAGASLDGICALQTEIAVKPIYEGVGPMQQTLARLGELGFEITGLYPVSRDAQLRVIEFDCVMVRAA